MEGRGAVVVTGASSGIGLATTLGLARRGWAVFPGVRRAEDSAQILAAAGALGVAALVRPIALDVTSQSSIAAALADVEAMLPDHDGRLAGLVNNAGIALAGPLEEVPLSRLRELLDINVIGAVAMTQAFLPRLRRDRGRIINISSVSGRIAPPFLGAYAASKFALEALSDALRVELRPWRVPVILIEPGPVATPIWAKGEAAFSADRAVQEASPYAPYIARAQSAFRRSATRSIPAREVAEVIATALAAPRPRARYGVGRNRIATALIARLAPDGLRDRLLVGRERMEEPGDDE